MQPSVAKDYQLFLNLVEFLHRFFLPPFPSASQVIDSASADYSSYIAALPSWVPRHTTECLRALSLWTLPWIFPFGSALVHLSSRHPLVSGFYKLIGLLISIAQHYHLFDESEEQHLSTLIGPSVVVVKDEDAEEKMEDDEGEDEDARTRAVAAERAEEMRMADMLARDRLNRRYVIELLRHFLTDVFHRMAPFTAELLFSCIRLLLSVTTTLSPIEQQLPLLRRALQLGLSYSPAAELAITTMERWNEQPTLSVILRRHLHSLLPLMQDYLRLPQQSDGPSASSDGPSAVLANAATGGPTSVDRALAFRLLELLGSIGGVAQHVIDDPAGAAVGGRRGGGGEESLMADSSLSSTDAVPLVAWSSRPCIRYPLPFSSTKLDVELDDLLPRLSHLAAFSTHRPIKVAAAEALHSIVIFMIAQAARDPNRGPAAQQQPASADAGDAVQSSGSTDYSPLFQHLFPVLLRLACDGETVLQRLFSGLVSQLIHWYTNREQTYVKEMRLLLDALCEGVGDPVNSGLRHFCASSLSEFFLWSLKHSGGGGGGGGQQKGTDLSSPLY